MKPEIPESDAADQQRQVFDEVDNDEIVVPPEMHADPADAADQQRDVPDYDDDDRG